MGGKVRPSAKSSNSFVEALQSLAHVVAPFTGTRFERLDGAGKGYYASLETGEVFLVDYALGSVRFLADSMASVERLEAALSEWHRLAKAKDIDTEDVIDGRVEVDLSSRGFSKLARQLEALSGRVDLNDDNDVSSRFDEILLGIAGSVFRCSAKATVFDDHERAIGLIQMLSHRGLDESENEPGNEPVDWLDRSQDAIYCLWRWYFDDNDRLSAALAQASKSQHLLVRDAACFITDLDATPTRQPAWSHLRATRDLWLEQPTALDAPAIPHDDLIGEGVEAGRVREKPTNAQSWDALTYRFYQAKKWSEMERCAEISISLRPEHYYGYLQRGIARSEQGRHQESIDDYDRALCFSFHDNLFVNKALSWMSLGNPEAAIANLAQLPAHSRTQTLRRLESEFGDLAKTPAFRRLLA